ncbi:phage shock protein A (PspA) family protein [Bacillus sp. OV322]|uniref:PspA/IM30 family protein n=1 Tax=Bacillus sp. OV322 TaxID=1882764 RepID=UPI0008F09F79|nr:PspA/IM30 family protein [Bacillus sp. OV322]SFC87724.1 phage shock protein A (PspA) family protein [Bacillus sp. OV322]
MGIFKRLKTITMAEINEGLDRIEDPIAMLNEYSREMENEIAKGQKALAAQVFTEKKQEALISETKALVEKRTRQTKLAIKQEEEAMAKLAIQEKLTSEKQLSLYQEQLESIKEQTQILLEKLEQLKETYQYMQQKKILLASRANVARSIKQIQKSTVSFQTDSIARGIARAEDRILLMEAEVQTGQQFYAPLAQYHPLDEHSISDEAVNSEYVKLKNEKEGILS